METLPYELIYIIYDYLHLPIYIASLASTNNYLYNCLPKKHRRILNICSMYRDINCDINEIKYFISTKTSATYKRSMRIDHQHVHIYINSTMISTDQRSCLQDRIRNHTIKLPDNLHIQSYIDIWTVDTCFLDHSKKIRKILSQRHIAISEVI